ncbi:MAG: hypothetical protein O3A33_14155 [Chloroflexi bacterium]|nr:hypothetical protein [Chloroflexota bacterium]
MADESVFVRDLLRRKALVGTPTVQVLFNGFLDYGINVRSGYISDLVADIGNHDDEGIDITRVNTDRYLAVAVPPGKWNSMKFRNVSTSSVTGAVIIAPAFTDPGAVEDEAIFTLDSTKETGADVLSIQYEGEGNTSRSLDGGAVNRIGQYYTASQQQKLHQARFRIRKSGSPSGSTLVCKIANPTNIVIASSNSEVAQEN